MLVLRASIAICVLIPASPQDLEEIVLRRSIHCSYWYFLVVQEWQPILCLNLSFLGGNVFETRLNHPHRISRGGIDCARKETMDHIFGHFTLSVVAVVPMSQAKLT